MNKELELWQFVATRLQRNESAVLLVVAQSSGSSPGRQGYKMAVAEDGELIGSIGGGVMEVNLVGRSREILRDAGICRREDAAIVEQIHRRGALNASGMICSGKQTVIFKLLRASDLRFVESVVEVLIGRWTGILTITRDEFKVLKLETGTPSAPTEVPATEFRIDGPDADTTSKVQNSESTAFIFTESLGFRNDLYIIGGGHCALALSELMSKLDFHISIIDDRPELNTIEKNRYAHEIKIVDSYERISDYVSSGQRAYVVVMTLGYKTDEQVIRSLIDEEFKYLGVLGSKAKMATMLAALRKDGIPNDMLDRIRTPIGLRINSRTPEEIAVSIAAEIISVKNG